jgi:hypothetical protein
MLTDDDRSVIIPGNHKQEITRLGEFASRSPFSQMANTIDFSKPSDKLTRKANFNATGINASFRDSKPKINLGRL